MRIGDLLRMPQRSLSMSSLPTIRELDDFALHCAVMEDRSRSEAKTRVCRARSIISIQFDRNATIGSIRDAFQAGIYPAIAATAIRSVPTPINVTGFAGRYSKQQAAQRARQNSRPCHSQRET